ncbi:MAG: hypothetical protein ACLFSZ_04740 [Puniceicoccaceae bacterium]
MDTLAETGLDRAKNLIDAFLDRSGITGAVTWRDRRYLWTDAFGAQACFGLARCLDAPIYRQHALALIEAVHVHLGRHRCDDPQGREGWISGLPEKEGVHHPTLGGLRIGKPRPERPPGGTADERLEWERDGQYFHYLTRWMQTLLRAGRETGDHRFVRWAAELAQASSAFVSEARGRPRMYWKMSIDLSRPLVSGMGAHDPLEGLICVDEIRRRAPNPSPSLPSLQSRFAALCEGRSWATPDALGIGGLFLALSHLSLLAAEGEPEPKPLRTEDILLDAIRSLDIARGNHRPEGSAGERIAFRECGLSLGLRVFDACVRFDRPDPFEPDLLKANAAFAEEIETFWADPENHASPGWMAHGDINAVMLAASLVAAHDPWAFTLRGPAENG